MSARVVRAALVLVVAAGAVWGFAATSAQTPYPASQFSGNTGRVAADAVVYSQPPSPAGGLLLSSKKDPDGSATDEWVWDDFTLGWTQSITEVRWRGGYDPTWGGMGGPVFDFTVEIYATDQLGIQPDLGLGPLVRHEVLGNANETPAEVLGGVQTYNYQYVLPQAFQATAGTKYWVQIEAFQHNAPDWGLAKGTGGDNRYFRRVVGPTFQFRTGDAAFELLGPLTVTPTGTATATATPTATATATPAATATPTGTVAAASPTATATATATVVSSPYEVFLPMVLH